MSAVHKRDVHQGGIAMRAAISRCGAGGRSALFGSVLPNARAVVALALAVFAQFAHGQALPQVGEIPTQEDCLAYIAILPTFRSEKMASFYAAHPNASAKELVEKIQWLADRGDKYLQYTYSQLLLNGYCVPKNVCAAQRYLLQSRGGPNNWEQSYPDPPAPQGAEPRCD